MNATRNTSEAPVGTSRPSVEGAAEKLKDEGRRLAKETTAEMRNLAQERKRTAATFLQDMGAAVSAASGEMRNRGHDASASFIDVTAEEMTRLGEGIDRRELGDLVREVETFARRRPTLFFGASLLAGFAAMRFFKASADDRSAPHGSDGAQRGSE